MTEVPVHWGVHEDVYCAGKESTFQFLEGVLKEVIRLFPSQYIHIGGDEVLLAHLLALSVLFVLPTRSLHQGLPMWLHKGACPMGWQGDCRHGGEGEGGGGNRGKRSGSRGWRASPFSIPLPITAQACKNSWGSPQQHSSVAQLFSFHAPCSCSWLFTRGI